MPFAAKVANELATSITLGLATPSTTEGDGTMTTLSGMPALLAASITLSTPTFMPSGT